MKRDAFQANGLRIETSRDWNGRWFVCWKPNESIHCRDRKSVLRFAAWPSKTPTGDALRSWLTSMEQLDADREASKASDGLTVEHVATGFGPECHLDETDPNHNTRTII